MNKQPLVSICIPNYNYENYINEAVDSALGQTYKNTEIIIADNCSTDGSMAALSKYGDKIKIYQNNENVGIADNHNIAANYANGDYFCLLSSDDILNSKFIEKTVKLMLKFENSDYDIGMVMAEKNIVDERGIVTEFAPFYASDFVCKGESHAKVSMMGNPTPPSFCLVKKSAFAMTKGFQKIYGTAHDWGFMFDMNMVSDVGYISEKLGLYRVHNGISTSSVNDFRYICNIHTLKLDIAERAKESEYLCQFIDESIKKTSGQAIKWGRECLKNGNFEAARKYVSLAALFDEKMTENLVCKAILKALESNDPIQSIKDMEKDVLTIKPRTEPYAYPKDALVL